jgi:CIC family chloride channel protein
MLRLAIFAFFVGGLTGLIASLFRLAIEHADQWRGSFIGWAHEWSIIGMLLVVAMVATASGFAAWLVRRFSPHATGSGIPQVEAVTNGTLPHPNRTLIPVKFIGGWLAIGAGLSLGREGPSIQIGATIGSLFAKGMRFGAQDRLALLVGGAGAGLATAFNAPLAGAIFVLEELVRRFDTRFAVAALTASSAAIGVARLILGNSPDFEVGPIPSSGFGVGILFALLGVLAGLIGVAYNRALIGALNMVDRLAHWPIELRAALIGAAVGIVAWCAPQLVGSGDNLTQQALSGTVVLSTLPLIFLVRFAMGAVSYAANTPGGLFAPMLVLGSQLGLLFGSLAHMGFPGLEMPATGFAIAGMAALFVAVVRAPVTGIILVTEMTGNVTLLLPMLFASAMAMVIPAMLQNMPIYETLSERLSKANSK